MKWQDISKILAGMSTVGVVGLFAYLFLLTGIDYIHSGDSNCTYVDGIYQGHAYINITTRYWNFEFEHLNPDSYIYLPKDLNDFTGKLTRYRAGDLDFVPVLYKKSNYGRKLWVNLDRIDNIIDTQPNVKVDWMVPARGKGNWRLIKEGDTWSRLKNNRIKLIGYPENTYTDIKWSFLVGEIDIDPIWFALDESYLKDAEVEIKDKEFNSIKEIAKEIRFTNLKKDFNIKEEAEKVGKTAKDYLNVKKTNYYGDVDIRLMHYKNITKNVSYDCNCKNVVVETFLNGTKVVEIICDTCYKDVIDEALVEINPETYILKNDDPIYEVMMSSNKFEKMTGGWGYSVWTDVIVMDMEIEGATWWNVTYPYRYPIELNTSAVDIFSVNDNRSVDGTVIWSYIGENNYLYSTGSGPTGDLAVANETTEKWWENETSRTGNLPTSIWSTLDAIGVYHFATDTISDSTTHSHDCTNYGSTLVTGGVFGKWRNFDGTNDYIDCGDIAEIDGAEALTDETWIFPDAWVDTDTIAEKGNVFLLGRFNGIGLTNGGFGVRQTSWKNADLAAPLPTGKLYHFVGVYNGSNVLLYVNGELNVTGDAITGAIDSSAYQLRIGGRGTSLQYDGKIDEHRIYEHALTADEIWQHYQNGIGNHTHLGAEEMEGITMTIVHPTNTTYDTTSINLNWTNSTETDWVGYNLNGAGNVTLTGDIIMTAVEGSNYVIVYGNDTSGVIDSDEQWFTVDFGIIVTVDFPENITYTTDSVWFNVTTDKVADWCGYSLDDSDNITMSNSSGNWNHHNSSMIDGTHKVIFYCNTSSSTINQSEYVYFTVDTEPPVIEINSPTNTTYSTKTVWFNITAYDITNTTEWCGYSLDDGDNITMTNSSGNWNAVNTSMWDQYHTVTFYCNDSNGNIGSATRGFTSQYENVTRCTTLDVEGRYYYLRNDITDYNISACINITADHIIFDGMGHTIDGVDESTTYGVYSYKTIGNTANITVDNFTVTDWYYGVYFENTEQVSISNVTASSNYDGFYLDTLFINNEMSAIIANDNTNYGVNVRYVYSSSFYNMTIKDNVYGTVFIGPYGNTIYDSIFQDNTNYGMRLAQASPGAKDKIYNNLFNNTINMVFYNYDSTDGDFNTTKQVGTRIYSNGTYIGGNYWTDSDGNYSDTCTDADYDGFCDVSYTITTGIYDYLPYSNVYGYIDIILPENITYNVRGQTLNWTSTTVVTDANYSLNGNTNITLMDGGNIKNDTFIDSQLLIGSNYVTIYMEKSGGDTYEATRHFSLEANFPTWRNLTYDDLAILYYDNTITINVTDDYIVNNVTVEHNGVNYTGTNISDMWTITYNISSVGDVIDTVWMEDVVGNINSTTFTYHGADINITYSNPSEPYMMPNATGYSGMYPMRYQPPITIFYNNGNGSDIYVNVTINTTVDSCLEFYLYNDTLLTGSVETQAYKFTSPSTTSMVVESMSNNTNVAIYGWCDFVNCVSGNSYYYEYWFDFYNA